MRSNKKLWALALSAMLMGGCLAALAQEKVTMEDVDHRVERLSKELNLTADQKEKLKPILEQQSDAWKTVRDDKSLTEHQRHAKVKEIHDKYVPEINTVLTPEQQEKWKEIKEEAHEKHKESMKNH